MGLVAEGYDTEQLEVTEEQDGEEHSEDEEDAADHTLAYIDGWAGEAG